jgi:hypothetical protein
MNEQVNRISRDDTIMHLADCLKPAGSSLGEHLYVRLSGELQWLFCPDDAQFGAELPI